MTGTLYGPPSQGAWSSDNREAQRGFPVASGVRGVIESGFLKAEQTYGDVKVTMVRKKSSGVHGSGVTGILLAHPN